MDTRDKKRETVRDCRVCKQRSRSGQLIRFVGALIRFVGAAETSKERAEWRRLEHTRPAEKESVALRPRREQLASTSESPREVNRSKNCPRAKLGFVKPIRNELSKTKNIIESRPS